MYSSKRGAYFFFQAEDGIRAGHVTGVQTCALPIFEPLAYLFGANKETLPYVVDYMSILLIFSLIIALEVGISIFVRNDGAPQIAMAGLVVTAILNIGLNY